MLDQLFIYFPSAWTEGRWSQISGLPLEEVWIPTGKGVRVFGWYVQTESAQPVLLWCHGNAGNIANRLENLAELYRRGLSVFIFDYRGYGKSSGSPTESGLYQDALAAYDFLTKQRHIQPERLVIFGRSMGSAVAAEVTSRRPAAGLILEGSFPSIQSMADVHYLGLPARWFVEAEFNLGQKVTRISIPKLFIHGERDTIVPIQLGKQVYEAAPNPKEWFTVVRAGHNDVPFVGGQSYFRRLVEFIRKVVR